MLKKIVRDGFDGKCYSSQKLRCFLVDKLCLLFENLPNFNFLVQLAELDAFRMATVVKVNPDSPQKQIRFLTLSG